MKIGILTFYYAHNYGAVLQAYALLTYLNKIGHESYIIPYRSKAIVKMYPRKLKPFIVKKDILCPAKWVKCIQEIKKTFYTKNDWKIRYCGFEKFIKNHLIVDESVPWYEVANAMDEIFFGSDQIWERTIIGPNDKIYIGDFQFSAHKISYAASCYSEKSIFTKFMLDKLNEFSLISVREDKLAKRLEFELQKNIDVVCDPVFLLNKADYKKFIDSNNEYNEYILFYFVSEDEDLQKICNQIREQANKRVLEIHYFKTKKKTHLDFFCNLDPIKFLTLFFYADFVYTNSFHGTAFSIIFEKNFYVKSNNIRITNVLETINLKNRIINSYEDWTAITNKININYKIVSKLLKEYVEHSKRFIEKAIHLEEKGHLIENQ